MRNLFNYKLIFPENQILGKCQNSLVASNSFHCKSIFYSAKPIHDKPGCFTNSSIFGGRLIHKFNQ